MNTEEKPYYLDGRAIFKRPVARTDDQGRETITLGFLVCEVSEFVDEQAVLEIFNKSGV